MMPCEHVSFDQVVNDEVWMMEYSLEDRGRIGVSDAVLLEDYTSQEAFVDNLEKRFKEKLIYTYIGPVLVSVNPYKELNIYGQDHIKVYENRHFFEVPPHVFAITDNAYRSLREEHSEQCILISGESGSGKTEASKKVLQYIAAVTEHRGAVEKVKDKLLLSNPLLEAFGNAKTNRNDNSSRFGKYMDVQFDFQGLPVGGIILNYFLEKSRVIHQAPGERNFHIFYQLLAGASDQELFRLSLNRNLEAYDYLGNSKADFNPDSEARAFGEVRKALKTLEFGGDEESDVFSIVGSILHLGNVMFGESDGSSRVSIREVVEYVAKLLGCDTAALVAALTHRTISAHGDVVTSPLNKEMALYARDALAKAVYDRLFTWLVQRLNSSLEPQDKEQKYSALGILDIYGFEIFEKNSFEQLCINFCNEKLQQLFIELTLRSEQEEYQKEGIEWQHVEYFDNKVICELIEEKHKGIIPIMDEECLRPGDATDKTLLAKMNKNFGGHKHYISHEKADKKLQKIMGRDEFKLIHYAGEVTYNVAGFIEKNNDLLFRDLREVMSRSTNPIISSTFPSKELESKKRPDTAITQFKVSVNNLMDILIDKEPSYIRCIKPNDFKQSETLDRELVGHQVKYLGLMENLRVRRAGFAYRRLYEKFLHRYKCLSNQTWPNFKSGDEKEGVRVLIKSLGYKDDEFQLGKTKLFIRHPKTLFHTEDSYQAKKNDIASIIQAHWKGLVQRRKYLQMKAAAVVVQKWMRRYLAQKEAKKRKEAAIKIVRLIKGYLTRNGPPTETNKDFIELAKAQWLIRLSKSLPLYLLDRRWPSCPYTCTEASELLEKFYRSHLSRVYRLKLTPERQAQFQLKVLAESLFKNKKKSYKESVPQWFQSERLTNQNGSCKDLFQGIIALSGDKEVYSTPVMKYDRHGYKPRERILILTNSAIYLVDAGKSVKQKHRLPLNQISLVVTTEKDKILVIRLSDDLINKDKGDLILQVPHLIEAVIKIISVTKNPDMLTILDKRVIEHHMKQGKHGIIEITTGSPQGIQKNKNGNLLIVVSP